MLFGLLLDYGQPRLVFLLLAAFLIAASLVVVLAQAAVAARKATAGAGELPAE